MKRESESRRLNCELSSTPPEASSNDWSEVLSRTIAQQSVSDHNVKILISLIDTIEAELIRSTHEPVEELIRQRIVHAKRLFEISSELASNEGVEVQVNTLWSRYAPLAQLVLAWPYKGNCSLIGVAGPPGAGKTTLAKILAMITYVLTGRECISVSLDDFYLSPVEREHLGYKWRAVPGTHDLRLLEEFIAQIKNSHSGVWIPSYDSGVEQRRAPHFAKSTPGVCFFEGWFVGSPVHGYEILNECLDGLVYLDVDLGQAYTWRVRREAAMRAGSAGKRGMTEEQVERFWKEVLYPGTMAWVLRARDRADLVVELDQDRNFRSVFSRPKRAEPNSGRS